MLESLRDIEIVGDVRGAGYFQAIELVKDRDTKQSFDHDESEELLRGFLSGELFRRGLICRADDRGDPVIQLSPPLIAGPAAVRGDRGDPAAGPHRGVARASRGADADRRAAAVGGRPASSRPGTRRRSAPVRSVHSTELLDPTPWLTRRRAAADDRHPARLRRSASASTSRAWPRTGSPASGSASASSTTRCPAALLQAAEEHALPVFEVPYELPFIAITERAFSHLVSEQYDALRRSTEIQGRLERLVLEERGLGAVMRDGRRRDRRRARCVLSARGETIAAGGRARARTSSTRCAARPPAAAPSPAPLDGRALVAARHRPRPRAGAGVAGRRRPAAALGDFERLILQQAATVVALELMRVRIARDTERRLAGDVLAEALTGRLHPEELAARLRPFGLGDEVAVLAFATRRSGRRRAAARRPRSRAPTCARSSPCAAPLLCAIVDRAPAGATRSSSPARCARSSPVDDARRARGGQPRGERAVAAAQLPRGALRAGGRPLRQRQRARGRLASRPRLVSPAAVAAGRRGAALVLRQRPGRRSSRAIPATPTSCCARSTRSSSTTATGSTRPRRSSAIATRCATGSGASRS